MISFFIWAIFYFATNSLYEYQATGDPEDQETADFWVVANLVYLVVWSLVSSFVGFKLSSMDLDRVKIRKAVFAFFKMDVFLLFLGYTYSFFLLPVFFFLADL